MSIEILNNVRENHEKAANALLESIERVRTSLGINRGRTSFHDMRFHFWREHEEIEEAKKEARQAFENFCKRHAGAVGARTHDQWLRTSDAEIRNLPGLTDPQREELRGLLEAYWATGGTRNLEQEMSDKSLREREDKILPGDAATFQDTLEMSLFTRMLHASQVREHVRPETFNVLVDLNQRRLLSHVQQALIDDFLSMAENYANHIRRHAATLPENARNIEHEKRMHELLNIILSVGPQAAAVQRAVFTEHWLQSQQRWLKNLQEAQKLGGKHLKEMEAFLAGRQTIEEAIKESTTAVERLQRHVKTLRQNLAPHERDVPCREEIADADLESFLSQERRRLGNGVPEFERGANPKRKHELLEQYKKVLIMQRPHVIDVQVTMRETPQGLRWRITKTIRLSSTASTDALEEIYGELSRNILDTANVSVRYQARNLNVVGITAEAVRRFFGRGLPGPGGGEVPVRLGHAMYANMLLTHTQHATLNMFPGTAEAGRKEQIEKVLSALELSGQLGASWRRYGSSSMSLLSRYEGLLAARGHFGPYMMDMIGGGLRDLDRDQLQHYLSRPLPISIQRALNGGDFAVTSQALQQYLYIIRNDFAPRLQWVVLMNDGLETLNNILESVNPVMNTITDWSAYLPAKYTQFLAWVGVPIPSPFDMPANARARMEASEQFRKAILHRRDQFQAALKSIRGRQEEVLKSVTRIESAHKRLQNLLTLGPRPEDLLAGSQARLKMGEEACAKHRKEYVDIIRELESAQGELASVINETNEDLEDIIGVRSLRSFQYGNLGDLDIWGVAFGAWWTTGFQMGQLGRLPVVRHIRKILNPFLIPLERVDSGIANATTYGVNRAVVGAGRLLRGAGRLGREVAIIRPDVNRLLAELGRTDNVTVASFQKILATVPGSRQPEVLERLIRTGNLSTSQRQLISLALNGNSQMINLVRINEAIRILGIHTLTAQQQSLEILSVLRAVPPGRDYIQLVNILLENRNLSPSQRMFFNALIHEGNAAMELPARIALGSQILQPVLGEILINPQVLETIIKTAHATEQEALRIAYNNLRANYDALRSATQTGNQAAINAAQNALRTSERAVVKILEIKEQAIANMLRAPGVGLPRRLAEQCANRLVRSGVCGLESAAANANGLGLLTQEAPRAAVPVLRIAVTRSVAGAGANLMRNATRSVPTPMAASNATRFLRLGGRFLTGGLIAGSVYLEETNISETKAHAERCRKALEADLEASFPLEKFRRENGDYVHVLSGVRFNVSSLRRAVADHARFIGTDATIGRGRMLLEVGVMLVAKRIVPVAVALAVIEGIAGVIRDYRAGVRNRNLRALFRDTPVEILAMADASHLSGMRYGELMNELGDKVMFSEGGTARGMDGVREAMNKYRNSFILREVTALCAVQGIPPQVLISGNESLADLIGRNSDGYNFNFRGNDYDAPGGLTHIRADIRSFLVKLMVISLLRKREQLQRHEQAQSGPNRLTPDQEQKLRSEIAFLEQQYGQSQESSVLTIGDMCEEHSRQQYILDNPNRNPNSLRVRDIRYSHINVDEVIPAHHHADRLSLQAEEMLIRLGAVRVITRVRNRRREALPIDRQESLTWQGTVAFRIVQGGHELYVAMIGNRLMWSSADSPGWQQIERARSRYVDGQGRAGNAHANALADFFTRLSDHIEGRLEHSALEAEGVNILQFAGAARTRITLAGASVPIGDNVSPEPAGVLDAYVLTKTENGTSHSATFVWGGADWYWFSPESPQWQRVSAASEAANPLVKAIEPQLVRAREIMLHGPVERAKIAEEITRKGMLDAGSMVSGGVRDAALQTELFGDGSDASDVYVFPSSLGDEQPTTDWAHGEPYVDLIAMMADELAPPSPAGRWRSYEVRPLVIQARRVLTIHANGQKHETILLTGVCGVGNGDSGDTLSLRAFRHVAMTRRVTVPPSVFQMGSVFQIHLEDTTSQAWRKEAAELLQKRSKEQAESSGKYIMELEAKAEKDIKEIAATMELAVDRLFDRAQKTRTEILEQAQKTGADPQEQLKKLVNDMEIEMKKLREGPEKDIRAIRDRLEKSRKELRGL